ncbi:hypothetical protein EVAR_11686_1 [Eumeta japonica]|uniref:Uncharacterized protein n=1 Tax=Eumeta variegata TaxID=151549 RepID=A0A4C1U4Q0_EUMVA|nr:hypothetical protein EVAR_11686_1 [Eumeta japonica]
MLAIFGGREGAIGALISLRDMNSKRTTPPFLQITDRLNIYRHSSYSMFAHSGSLYEPYPLAAHISPPGARANSLLHSRLL